MAKILLILCHPNYEDSFANKQIITNLKSLIPNIEIDHINSLYPDEKINIKAEQEKLINNDIIIFQFPMYWHNRPYLLSKWFEEVYQNGFAYGTNGDKLKNKKIIVSITLGNVLEFFKDEISLDNLLSPFKASAKYTQQIFCGYVATDKIIRNIKENKEKLNDRIKALELHAKKIVDIINNINNNIK